MDGFHGTTIVCVRRDGRVAIGGDGQVTLGDKVMKGNARKVRRLHAGKVLAGFAGGTADAFLIFSISPRYTIKRTLERGAGATRPRRTIFRIETGGFCSFRDNRPITRAGQEAIWTDSTGQP